nr:glycine-rich protein-like [Cherax quadricarinatus]
MKYSLFFVGLAVLVASTVAAPSVIGFDGGYDGFDSVYDYNGGLIGGYRGYGGRFGSYRRGLRSSGRAIIDFNLGPGGAYATGYGEYGLGFGFGRGRFGRGYGSYGSYGKYH